MAWHGRAFSILLGSFIFLSCACCHAVFFDDAKSVSLKVAVVYVEDKTGYPDGGFSDEPQFMLTQALRDIEGFDVVPVDLVREMMSKLKFHPPLNDREMLQLAAELKVDWAIRATLESVTLDRKANLVSISASAEALSCALGIVVSRASSIGTCAIRGDPSNQPLLYTAIIKAIANASSLIAHQLEYSAKVKGLLLLPPMNNHIRANIGSHQGLKVGAHLLIVWRDRPMAWAKVVDLDGDDCHAKLERIVPGVRLEPNMKVLVVSNPAVHEALPYREKIERELKVATRHLVIAIAVTFGVLIATDVIK